MTKEITVEVLQDFADAWNRHDVDALMTFMSNGTRVEVHGCDLFAFRSGRIALKNSYRKNRPPVSYPTS